MIGEISEFFGKYFDRGTDVEYFDLKRSLAKRFGVGVKDVEVSRFNEEDGIFGTPMIGLGGHCSVRSVPVNAYNFVAEVSEESYLVQSNLDGKVLDVRHFERLGKGNGKGIEDLE